AGIGDLARAAVLVRTGSAASATAEDVAATGFRAPGAQRAERCFVAAGDRKRRGGKSVRLARARTRLRADDRAHLPGEGFPRSDRCRQSCERTTVDRGPGVRLAGTPRVFRRAHSPALEF